MQEEDQETHSPWDFLENFQNNVKRGKSSKGKTYYYVRDTTHKDMDVYRSSGSREYVGAVPLEGGVMTICVIVFADRNRYCCMDLDYL